MARFCSIKWDNDMNCGEVRILQDVVVACLKTLY
jgi:hypothetical protein